MYFLQLFLGDNFCCLAQTHSIYGAEIPFHYITCKEVESAKSGQLEKFMVPITFDTL